MPDEQWIYAPAQTLPDGTTISESWYPANAPPPAVVQTTGTVAEPGVVPLAVTQESASPPAIDLSGWVYAPPQTLPDGTVISPSWYPPGNPVPEGIQTTPASEPGAYPSGQEPTLTPEGTWKPEYIAPQQPKPGEPEVGTVDWYKSQGFVYEDGKAINISPITAGLISVPSGKLIDYNTKAGLLNVEGVKLDEKQNAFNQQWGNLTSTGEFIGNDTEYDDYVKQWNELDTAITKFNERQSALESSRKDILESFIETPKGLVEKQFLKDNVQLDNGDYVNKGFFGQLSAAQQSDLKKLGIDKFNEKQDIELAEFEASNIKLNDGSYVDKNSFDDMNPVQQEHLIDLGVDKFNEEQNQILAVLDTKYKSGKGYDLYSYLGDKQLDIMRQGASYSEAKEDLLKTGLLAGFSETDLNKTLSNVRFVALSGATYGSQLKLNALQNAGLLEPPRYSDIPTLNASPEQKDFLVQQFYPEKLNEWNSLRSKYKYESDYEKGSGDYLPIAGGTMAAASALASSPLLPIVILVAAGYTAYKAIDTYADKSKAKGSPMTVSDAVFELEKEGEYQERVTFPKVSTSIPPFGAVIISEKIPPFKIKDMIGAYKEVFDLLQQARPGEPVVKDIDRPSTLPDDPDSPLVDIKWKVFSGTYVDKFGSGTREEIIDELGFDPSIMASAIATQAAKDSPVVAEAERIAQEAWRRTKVGESPNTAIGKTKEWLDEFRKWQKIKERLYTKDFIVKPAMTPATVVPSTASKPSIVNFGDIAMSAAEIARLGTKLKPITESEWAKTKAKWIAEMNRIVSMQTQAAIAQATAAAPEALKAKISTQVKTLIQKATKTAAKTMTEVYTQTQTQNLTGAKTANMILTQTLTQTRTQVKTQAKAITNTAVSSATQTAIQAITAAAVASATATATNTIARTMARILTRVLPKTIVRARTQARTQVRIMPKIKLPPPEDEKGKGGKKTKIFPDGTATWRMGKLHKKIWHVLEPPYRQQNYSIVVSDTPPKGATETTATKVAETIQEMGGRLGKDITIDIGAFDMHLMRAKPKPITRFTRDIHGKTKHELTAKGARVVSGMR